MNGDTKTSPANGTTTGSSTRMYRETNLSTNEITDVDLTQSTAAEWNDQSSFDECTVYENHGRKQETDGDKFIAIQMDV